MGNPLSRESGEFAGSESGATPMRPGGAVGARTGPHAGPSSGTAQGQLHAGGEAGMDAQWRAEPGADADEDDEDEGPVFIAEEEAAGCSEGLAFVCNAPQVAPGTRASVEMPDGTEVLLVRLTAAQRRREFPQLPLDAAPEWLAIDNTCAHKSGRLCAGDIEEVGTCARGSHMDGGRVAGLCVLCPRHRKKFNEGRPGGGLYFSLLDGRSFTKADSEKHRDAYQQEVYAVHRRGEAVYMALAPLSADAVRRRVEGWRRGTPAASRGVGVPAGDQDPEAGSAHAAGITVGLLAAAGVAGEEEEGDGEAATPSAHAQPQPGGLGVPRIGRSRSLPRDHLDLRFSGDEEEAAATLPPPEMAASDGEAGAGTRLREAWFVHSWRGHGASSDSYDLVLRRYPHSVRPRIVGSSPVTAARRGRSSRRRRRPAQRPFLWHVTLEAPAQASGRPRPIQRDYTPVSSWVEYTEHGILRFAVKVYPRGRFTRWLRSHAQNECAPITVLSAVPTTTVPELDTAPLVDAARPSPPLPPLLVVVGGTGVAPALQCVREAGVRGGAPALAVVRSDRSMQDVLLREELAAAAGRYGDRVRVWQTLSREEGGGATVVDATAGGVPRPQRGRLRPGMVADALSWALARSAEDASEEQQQQRQAPVVVICGPHGFLRAAEAMVTSALGAAGIRAVQRVAVLDA